MSAEIFEDLLIVWCGRFIKYAYVDEDTTIVVDDDLLGLDFIDAKIEFSQNVEICKIIAT